jgi:serine/threonine-protein kinase
MSSLVFDKYEIIGQLARGGMGEVYLARQIVAGLERKVILKSLLPQLAEEEGFVEQFLDEARVTAALNHPNIVSIFEVGAWDGVYYIALEYIEGVDLAHLRHPVEQRGERLPPLLMAKVIHDAAIALDHAHHAVGASGEPLHVIHRDISPQNIMVRVDGVVKVVDFGVAKSRAQMVRTQTGLLKGKLQYMPPEQVRGAELDGRADQFALGSVLWELLAGQRLFKGGNEIETLQLVLSAPLVPPSRHVGALPDGLDDVVMRMLERDPAKRFATCGDAATALRGVIDAAGGSVDQRSIAQYVAPMVEQRKEKLGLNTPKDFLVSLIDGDEPPVLGSPATGTDAHTVALTGARKRRWPIAAGVGVALAAALGALLFVIADAPGDAALDDGVAPQPPPTEPAVTPPTSPPTPPVAAPPPVSPPVEPPAAEPTATPSPRRRKPARRTTPPNPAKAKPSATESGIGHVTLDATPWAQVFVDGRPIGSTPIYKYPLPAGKHLLRFDNAGLGKSVKKRIVVKPDAVQKIVVDLE